MSNTLNVDALHWLNDQGATFVLVNSRGKKPLYDGWETKPNDAEDAIRHARLGNNVGLLCGNLSNGIIVVDIDRDYRRVVSALGLFNKTLGVTRSNADDRGKLLFRAPFRVKTRTWRPHWIEPEPGEKRSPWAELLSNGRHALVEPSEFEGGRYQLVNYEHGIAEINEDELAFTWYLVTEGRPGLPKQPEPKAPARSASTSNIPQDAAKSIILTHWSTFDVFDHFGLATNVSEEKDGQVRLLGNGGLLIKANGEGWYSFADNTGGGDSISAWAWQKHQTATPTGKLYWDVLREMAEAKQLTLPDARVQVHTNGVSGTNAPAYTDDIPDEPPGMGSENPDIYQADDDPRTFNIAKVQALIAQIQPYQGNARRAGMEALKVVVGKLAVDDRVSLKPHLAPLFDSYKQQERIDNFLSTCASPAGRARFQPISFEELISRPPKTWLVDQIFGLGDIGEIFGPPGSAKTFGVIDLIFAVCLGTSFARRFAVTRSGNVAYCAGEGLSGLPARFGAAALGHGVNKLPGFTFFEAVPQLFEQDSADSIIRFIAEWKERQDAGIAQPLDLLIIDTQHSATVGADENSAQDMGKVLALAKMAIRELHCAVLLVHHSNRAGTGERGSSAMRGSFDFMIEFKPIAGKFVMSCEKLKDAVAWKPQTFDLVDAGDSARVWWDEPSDQSESQKEKGETLLAELRKRPGRKFTAKNLAELVGGSQSATTNALVRLVDRGEIKRALADESKTPSNRNHWVYFFDPDS